MNAKPPHHTQAITPSKKSHAPNPPATSRSSLRSQMRAWRQALTTTQQQDAAIHLDRIVAHSDLFRRSRHIAFYIGNDGELDPYFLLQRAWAMGKVCYLPVITPRRSLWFAPYSKDASLALNRFGIPEPAQSGLTLASARILDLILMPLVAFDDQGHRLGMGAGFYDRTLSFLRYRHAWRKPQLLGIAHEYQRVPALPTEPWDIPLDGVATDNCLYLFRNNRA